jgi:hypothetical protein
MAGIGLAPLRKNLYDAMVEQPDAYLQLTVPRFALPRGAERCWTATASAFLDEPVAPA